MMPIIIDGIDTLLRLFVVLIWGRNFEEHKVDDEKLPHITILIPAYNEEKIISRCINSIKVQDYPQEKMEVIVIDDGSLDATSLEVAAHISANGKNGNNIVNGYKNRQTKTEFNGAHKNGENHTNGKDRPPEMRINGNRIPLPEEFNGSIKLLSSDHAGKPNALNAGLEHMNHSELVITIDSDVVLAPHAIRNAACAFLKNPEMGAATGNIEISWDILEERDSKGNLVLDKEGSIVTKKLNFSQNLLARCQFLEYLDAFRLGRQFQSIIHSTYILAGAFSIFRRDVLAKSPLYRSHTVSEDFDLTVDIHKKQVHVGYIADAKAYLEPIIEWDTLYAQRVRWCRGQLEVCGLHREIIGNKSFGPIGWFGFPQMLILDHTLSFPRLIWTFLILFFPLFGYSPKIIATAVFFMYLFYVGLAFLQTVSAYFIVDEDTKKQIEKTLAFCLVLPIYRLMTFYFRMSGYLLTLKEPPRWKVESPLDALRKRVDNIRNGNGVIANGRGNTTTFFKRLSRIRERLYGNILTLRDRRCFVKTERNSKPRLSPSLGTGLDRLFKKCRALQEDGKYKKATFLLKNALKATENSKDLLLLYIELGRLSYIAKWDKSSSP